MSSTNASPSISPDNLWVLENFYEQYEQDPSSVPEEWRKFFTTFVDSSGGSNGNNGVSGAIPGNGKAPAGMYIPKLSHAETDSIDDLNLKALLLMQAYRRHGHFSAHTNPLNEKPAPTVNLQLSEYGLSEGDLDKLVTTRIAGEWRTAPLKEFVERMKKTYSAGIGADFFYIRDEERRTWLIERMESEANSWRLNDETRSMIYEKLFNAEYFEKFLARRYVGKKRFSLEGAESLIPSVSGAIQLAGSYGIEQIVIGMAHRGRLNVLHNIMEKGAAQIFAEFDENISEEVELETAGSGDVKYHLGYSRDVQTFSGNKVHLSLAFNPSHLEVVGPVVMGSVRARQTMAADEERNKFMPILIHGDAAFSGQGINYEMLNMSNLKGYDVGGTFHIIVNNQVGFTTNPEDSRSTTYCTDLAKMLGAPVFHVNGDDPEACHRAVELCMEWRRRYKTDVFLDVLCYRRWGHNETDEPAFTQPEMYKKIKKHPTTVKIYEDKLKAEGFDSARIDKIKKTIQNRLDYAYEQVTARSLKIQSETLHGNWQGFRRENAQSNPETALSVAALQSIAERLTSVPEDFVLNNKLKRLLGQRWDMVFSETGRLDWGMGEAMAYASLLIEETPIRLSGQDVKRGTFSHRHGVLFDGETGKEYSPLRNLSESQAPLQVLNSLLSETAALGFEFGYSLADPRTLVIWEAQFGDFANGAQVIIDQFISSCEAKWNRMTGLVLLLPHGYEGQGPEHSSARLERYLQLCSQNNIQVCNCTTPAQFFHMMRRQMRRNYRKPLVVMSPKSLLRLPEATSPLADFSKGTFQDVLDEVDERVKPEKTRRILLCSGKIYYELKKERDERELFDIAIVRMEQLYPFPYDTLAGILQKYNHAPEIFWVQEEPRNQGAWIYLEHWISPMVAQDQTLRYLGRSASPAPATGYFKVHQREQREIIEQAISAE